MAQALEAKASVAHGEKKARLSGLAAALRVLASVALEQESDNVQEMRLEPATLEVPSINGLHALDDQGHRHQAEKPSGVVEARFYPAFHSEARLRVIATQDRTTLQLTSAENRFAPQVTHKVAVAPDCAFQFWSKLDAMLLAPFDIIETAGFDGITIIVDCQTPSASANFEAWSPGSTTCAGRLVDLIYGVAWENLSDPSAIQCLEHLHGYLRDELPARIIDSQIVRLRLFGTLAASHQEALRNLFGKLHQKKPLLMDMTNVEGMGTALYGVFQEFAASHQQLIFASSRASRLLLEEMQISRERIFDNLEDAIDFIKAR